MRLNLYWRGYDLIDIEVHALRRRRDDDDFIVIHSGVNTDLAEDIDPDTWAFGFQGKGG